MAFRQCFFLNFFFDTPELTKIVLPQKFYKILRRRHGVLVDRRLKWDEHAFQKLPSAPELIIFYTEIFHT